MKFSGNLFKIQTKISVSAFILMSAVSGAVSAMDESMDGDVDRLVHNSEALTPIKLNAEEAHTQLKQFSTPGERRRSLSDSCFSPFSSPSPENYTVRFANESLGVGENEADRTAYLEKMKTLAFKKQPDEQRKFTLPANRRGLVGKVASVVDVLVDIRRIHDSGFPVGYSPSKGSDGAVYGNPMRKEDLALSDEVVAKLEDQQKRRLDIKERLQQRARQQAKSYVEVSTQTDNVDGLPSLDALVVTKVVDQENIEQEIHEVSEAVVYSSAQKISRDTFGNLVDVIVDVDEEIESVDYQSALVQRESSSSQGMLLTSNYRAGSTLFAGREDELTIDGTKISYREMLSATDVSKANEYYTYLTYYVDGLELKGEDLRDYCEALLEQDADSFLGQSIDTVWSFLEQKMKEAADYLPGFHKVVIKKDKVKNACIQKNLEEAQSISVLKDEYGVLVDILRGVFNSDSSAMFADSQEIVGFQSAHWTPATISQGFKFLAAQCFLFHRTNHDLSQLLIQTNATHERQIHDYSVRQGDLTSAVLTNSQTIERQAREKSQLEEKLLALQHELDEMISIRAEMTQLKKVNAMLTRELANLKGKPFVSAKLDELKKK